MKKFLLLALVLLCWLSRVVGDDKLPNDINFPDDEFVVLNISEDQLQEVESLRCVTFTKEQLAELRDLSPDFPRRIGVASPFVDRIADSRFSPWPDQITGIWYSKEGVAVPRKALEGGEGWREFSKSLNASDAVLIDTMGGYAIGSRKVSKAKLLGTLEKLARKEPEGKEFYIFVLRPPVLDIDQEEQAVKRSIEELVQICREQGIGCRIGG